MTRLLATAAATLLAAAACNDEPVPLPGPSTLPNDFLIYNTSRFENTAKVIPPESNPACVAGAIALATGQPRPGELVTRPLTDGNGAIDTVTIGTATPYPINPTNESIATDNQLIRLADGSLLAMKNGYRWDAINPQPDWWNSFNFIGSMLQSYQRNTIYFWSSTDCGASWTRVGMIDPAVVAGGKYAWPQPVDADMDGVQDVDATGVPIVSVGGFDRPELYQDPWTQRIYVSGHGDGGPYVDGATTEDHHAELIFFSDDGGANWSEMPELDYPGKGTAPFVMTSTPNGRFYAFTCSEGSPRLIYTKTPGDPTLLLGQAVDDEGDCGRDVSAVIATDIWQPSISRVSLDPTSSVVRIAYPTKNGDGRQEYQVITAAIDDAAPDNNPDVTAVDKVVSDDAAARSVVYATFIDPDYVDYKTGNNNALLYWIESSIGGDPVKLCAKYKQYVGAGGITGSQYLSQTGGNPRCWSDATAIGDYMAGGFFYTDKLSYLAQWPEADGIHANVVKSGL